MSRRINEENYDRGELKKRETLHHCYVLLEYIWGKYRIEPIRKYTRDGIVGTTGCRGNQETGSRG